MTRNGFGFMEVLVFSAISGIFLLTTTQMFSGLFRSNRQLQVSADTTDAINHIRMILGNPTLCNCNLAPAAPNQITFSAAAVDSAAPPVITLTNGIGFYDSSCTKKGAILAQATPLSPPGGVWVTALQLNGFFQIDPSHYAANVHVAITQSVALNKGFGTAKDIPVLLGTTTAGGMVTINQCDLGASSALNVAQPFSFAVGTGGINLVDGQTNNAGFPAASTYLYPASGGYFASVPIPNTGSYLISAKGNFNWNTAPGYNCYAGPSWSDYITYTPSLSVTRANGSTSVIGTQGIGTPNSGVDFSLQQVFSLTAGDTLSFKLISQFAQGRSNAMAGGCVSNYSVSGGLLQVVAVQ